MTGHSYGLNTPVPPKSLCCNLIPKVLLLGWGPSGGCLDREGGASPSNRITGQRACLLFLRCKDAARSGQSAPRRELSLGN